MATTITRPVTEPVMQGAYKQEATATADGTIKSGFFIASLYNSGANAVTINGQSVPAGAVVTYPFVNKPYVEDVTFDATGSTILITVIY